MIKNLKINIAVLICTVFVFRILFVNIGVISSLNTQQNKRNIKAHFSTTIKKRRHLDALNNLGNPEYSIIEICEEDSNESKPFKSNSFVLINVPYLPIAGELENNLKKISSLSKHLSYTSSSRYLTFRAFRV